MMKVNILVDVETRDDLKRIGTKGETYADIVAHLVLMYKGDKQL